MLKALFLDDEVSICSLFTELFSSAFVDVVSFTDPKEAVSYSKTHPIDVIFMDYRMPGLNGEEAARQMPVEIPKYLFTGDLSVSFQYPFKDIFPKPGFIEGIQDVLQSFIQGKTE